MKCKTRIFTIGLTLILINTIGIGFTNATNSLVTETVTVGNLRIFNVPVDPGPTVNESLQGIDRDRNGVRDDIE